MTQKQLIKHVLTNVEARYPKLNQPYRYDTEAPRKGGGKGPIQQNHKAMLLTLKLRMNRMVFGLFKVFIKTVNPVRVNYKAHRYKLVGMQS